MSEGIAAHNRLVRLNRHVHQAAHHTRHRNNLGGIDVGINVEVLVALQNHSDFLERSITSTLADTIHGHLHLAGAIQYTLQGIGSSHTEIVVTVGRDACILDAVNVIHQILDLGTILIWQAIAGGVRNVNYGSTCLDDSLYHASQILIVGTTSVLSVELHILNILLGILDSSHGTLDDLLAVGIELIFDMAIAGTDTRMNSLMLSILQRLGSTVDILFHRTGQRTDSRPCYSLGNLYYGIEVTRA